MAKPQKTPIKPKVVKDTSSKKPSKENKAEARMGYPKESFFSKAKKQLVSFREWLNLNKVFFEAPAALFLSVMAVTLSYWQWQVSEEQTIYLKQQITIEHAQAMPQIIVREKGADSMTEVSKEEISIFNEGGIARDIDVMSRSTFVIFTTDGFRKTIPITDYYGEPDFTQNSIGLLATINNEKMLAKIVEIENEIRQLSWKDEGIREVLISRNIMVYYTDIFGAPHRDFFYINPVFGPQLGDTSIESDYFDKFSSMPNFASVTVKDILKIINDK